jgi:hypothetical protein
MPGALHVSNGDATDVPGTGLARSEPATPSRYNADRAGTIRQFTERDQAVEANRDRKHVLWFEAGLYD